MTAQTFLEGTSLDKLRSDIFKESVLNTKNAVRELDWRNNACKFLFVYLRCLFLLSSVSNFQLSYFKSFCHASAEHVDEKLTFTTWKKVTN